MILSFETGGLLKRFVSLNTDSSVNLAPSTSNVSMFPLPNVIPSTSAFSKTAPSIFALEIFAPVKLASLNIALVKLALEKSA